MAGGQLSVINSRCLCLEILPRICADAVVKWVDAGGGLEALLWTLFYDGGCSSRHMKQRRAGLQGRCQ